MPTPALQTAVLKVYANYQSLALLLEGCHWNVVGMHFYALHLLFDRLYGDVQDDIDPLAEHCRYLGIKVPFSLIALNGLNALEFPSNMSESRQFVESAIAAHVAIKALLDDAAITADIEDAGETTNLLQGLMTALGSRLFLLRSSLEGVSPL